MASPDLDRYVVVFDVNYPRAMREHVHAKQARYVTGLSGALATLFGFTGGTSVRVRLKAADGWKLEAVHTEGRPPLVPSDTEARACIIGATMALYGLDHSEGVRSARGGRN